MRCTWLGHACVLIEGSRRVVVDPYLPQGSVPRDVDMVAVTHGHADHMGDAVALARPTIAITEIAKYLARQGVPAEGMNIGGTITVEGVSFTMVPAVHSSGLEIEGGHIVGGTSAGFVIGMDGAAVYHAGDTALFSDMKLIGELYQPDVALLPIGGRYTMGPREAMMAAQFVGAPLVIPIHYGTWEKIAQDAAAFKHAIERTTDIRVKVLAPGDSIEVPLRAR
jgi:L-ascorbate metabolism protein UlaG (beta-lactamase superfamily)